jgi:3-phosphoshikimate 1-carboxyvinyltransferase
LPGDKSISHRSAMLAAMAEGDTRIENFAASDDCASTLECLRRLGVEIRREGSVVHVRGVGKTGFRAPEAPLDCGNSGTTMRLLAGVLAGQDFVSVLTGDESLSRRPMGRISDPLTRMGANIVATDGRAPLEVRGRHPLGAIDYTLPVASAQIKSCVLLAGLNSNGRTSVLEPVPTRDHTERMLKWFGVDVDRKDGGEGSTVSVNGASTLQSGGNLTVPADISAAAFFMVAATCLRGSMIEMHNVGLNPTRTAIIDVLTQKCGASMTLFDLAETNNEPVGTISVTGKLDKQRSNEVRGRVVANLIDEIPILAVLGTQLELGLEIRDAAELRVKESDRISAVVENLKRMGAEVEEFDDGLHVRRSELRGASVDSFGDHRIAMAFAVAGLLAHQAETEIAGAECVDVSFPGFFETLQHAVVYE